MKPLFISVLFVVLSALAAFAQAAPTTVEVFATGLFNPKDLEFDAEGNLYVAEAGAPGTVKVPLPAQYGSEGPIGYGGKISRITPDGKREDWVTGLPNLGIYSGGELLGPTGLAMLGGKLYMVQAAHMTESPWLNEVLPDHTLKRISDVGAFNKKYLASEDNGDAVPTGNPYDLIEWRGALYISDGNYNRLLKATPNNSGDGKLEIFAKSPRQTTTTGMTVGPDGALYVTQFGNAPYYAGSGRVDRVTADGQWESGYVKTLQNPLGVAFDAKGTMYVLQFASLFSPKQLKYLPYGGRILKVNKDRSLTPVVTGLTYPTFMKFDAKGTLWVVNYGNQSSQGQGQILKIRLGDTVGKGPNIQVSSDTPTEEVLRSEAIAREKLAAMNAKKAGDQKGIIIKVSEGTDTQKWGYDPEIAHVKAGQLITLVNAGQVPHTATSDTGAFDTGMVNAGETQSFRIYKHGNYPYKCLPHPWMKAKIIVEGDAEAPAAEAKPPASTLTAPDGDMAAGKRLVDPWALAGLGITLVALTMGVAMLMRKKK